MAKEHLLYKSPGVLPPGEVQIKIFDGGSKFQDISHLTTGILEQNLDFEGFYGPDPEKRHPYNLRPGQYIENADIRGINPLTRAPVITDPQPFTRQSGYGVRMPNVKLELPQLINETWYYLPRLTYGVDDFINQSPPDQALIGHGDGSERFVDHFTRTQDGTPPTMLLRAKTGPGRYGLKYTEGIEAAGSRNTNFITSQGRLLFGTEIQYFEPVEDVFFHSFDTSDTVNFKVTEKADFWGDEVLFSFPAGPGLATQLNVHLIPRQWFYFVYILAWYIIVTPFTMWYYPLAFVDSWWDRPPSHPYPFTGTGIWGDILGYADDYGVWWKVNHSPEFIELLSQVHDFEMRSYYMGIIWAGISDYYYRVRCFGSEAKQLCAVIEDVETGYLRYVWRRTKEEKDKITLVDSTFFPEGF